MYEPTSISIEAAASLQPVPALCLGNRYYYVRVWREHQIRVTQMPAKHMLLNT